MQSGLSHFKHADLIACPKSIFHGAQNTIRVVFIAFKIQHRIDDVFKQFRPGNHPLLGHVANDKDRRSRAFRVPHEFARHFLKLADGSGSRRHSVGIDRLNRIHDQGIRPQCRRGLEQRFKRGFRQDV